MNLSLCMYIVHILRSVTKLKCNMYTVISFSSTAGESLTAYRDMLPPCKPQCPLLILLLPNRFPPLFGGGETGMRKGNGEEEE